MATVEELKKQLAKANKALADTKASYTKGQQALAATKAELSVLEEAGVKIPKELTELKATDPEKYASELEKYNTDLTKMRVTKAEEAKSSFVQSTLEEVAKSAGITVSDIQDNIPPTIYNAYVAGNLTAEHVTKLALQHKTGKVTVNSPTTQTEFDFSSVAGGLLDEHTAEVDTTLNEKDYIL